MSAFIVTDMTIKAIVVNYINMGLQGEYPDPLQTANYLSDVLTDQNYASVCARYPGRAEEYFGGYERVVITEDDLKFRRVPKMGAVELLKLVQCLDYQSCETKNYENSRAYKLMNKIKDRFITMLPGYTDAKWGL